MTTPDTALKHGLGKDAIRRIGRNIQRVEPAFPERAFFRNAIRGLETMELKARVHHVAGTLRKYLPQDVPAAMAVLVKAGENWDPGEKSATGGFAAWPVIEWVGEYGIDHFDMAMESLRKLTGLFTAEFAIRGFIEKYPTRSMRLLKKWTHDSDDHVRRLVSEGTRPRLPWGRRLRAFQEDPRPVLGLLELLKDDPAEYVRRSVANNLNDIAKDHPETVLETCRRWAKGASDERMWVIKRATRTMVKEGHPGALAILGFHPEARISVQSLSLRPSTLTVGQDLQMSFGLRSRSTRPQALVIDFAIHHVKASGARSRKVFKLKTLILNPGEGLTITKTHKVRKISTRTYYPGLHGFEILINGRSRAEAEFRLKV
ncbi:MAG: DNA alkylation repair protein [Myxococcales bacterium]|nr:DNA alkylation repair protein [Myxococcales bacterium]